MMNKKEILYRKAKCSKLKDNYLKKINSLLTNANSVSFIDIVESNRIRKESWETTFKISEKKMEATPKRMQNLIHSLKSSYPEESFFVFIDDDWKYCGAFYISSLSEVKNSVFFSIIKDDIVFLNKELYISLDYYEMENQFFIDYSEKKNSDTVSQIV